MNQITHWLDNSNVYGSGGNDSIEVRRFHHGLLNGIVGFITWQQQFVFATFKNGIMHGPTIVYGIVPILNPTVSYSSIDNVRI